MIPNYTTFNILFPAFSDLEESFVTAWMDQVKIGINPKTFGNMYEQAVYNALAHKLSLYRTSEANKGEERGVIASESEGDISVSFAATPSTMVSEETDYTSTQYGRAFLTIRNSKVKRFIGMGTPNVSHY